MHAIDDRRSRPGAAPESRDAAALELAPQGHRGPRAASSGPLPQPEHGLIAQGLQHGVQRHAEAPGPIAHADDVRIRALLSMYFTRWSKFGDGWSPAPAIGMYKPDAQITDIAPNIEKLLKTHQWDQEYSSAATYAHAMAHLYGTVDQFQMEWDPGQAALTPEGGGIRSELSFTARISKLGLNINQRVHASILWERSGAGFVIARETLRREAFLLPTLGPF